MLTTAKYPDDDWNVSSFDLAAVVEQVFQQQVLSACVHCQKSNYFSLSWQRSSSMAFLSSDKTVCLNLAGNSCL